MLLLVSLIFVGILIVLVLVNRKSGPALVLLLKDSPESNKFVEEVKKMPEVFFADYEPTSREIHLCLKEGTDAEAFLRKTEELGIVEKVMPFK